MFNSDLSTNMWDHIQTIRRPLINRTGSTLTKGSLCALDLTGNDQTAPYNTFITAAVGTYTDTQHPLSQAIVPATAHLTGWLFVVAFESIANDAVGMFTFSGICEILSVGSSAFSNGDIIMPANGVHTVTAVTDGLVSVGIALETDVTAATSTLRWCIFEGWQLQAAGAAT